MWRNYGLQLCSKVRQALAIGSCWSRKSISAMGTGDMQNLSQEHAILYFWQFCWIILGCHSGYHCHSYCIYLSNSPSTQPATGKRLLQKCLRASSNTGVLSFSIIFQLFKVAVHALQCTGLWLPVFRLENQIFVRLPYHRLKLHLCSICETAGNTGGVRKCKGCFFSQAGRLQLKWPTCTYWCL